MIRYSVTQESTEVPFFQARSASEIIIRDLLTNRKRLVNLKVSDRF